MQKAKILIADTHALLLAAYRQLLEPDFMVVGTAENGHDLLELAQHTKPDVALLDIGMPLLSGLDVARHLKQRLPTVKLVFVTMMTDAVSVSEAFHSGAHGYVVKQCASHELIAAIYTVMDNRRYLSPLISAEVREAIETPWMNPKGFSGKLTPRQQDVLKLLTGGHSTKDIAQALKISIKSVEFHKGNITKRLGLHTIADLTKFALAHGLTSLAHTTDSPPGTGG